jgi:hypothetical protein
MPSKPVHCLLPSQPYSLDRIIMETIGTQYTFFQKKTNKALRVYITCTVHPRYKLRILRKQP